MRSSYEERTIFNQEDLPIDKVRKSLLFLALGGEELLFGDVRETCNTMRECA